MRGYPHGPDEARLRSFLEREEKLYKKHAEGLEKAKTAGKPRFFKRSCDTAVSLAALRYAFESSREEIRSPLQQASAFAVQAIEFGLELDPATYMSYLALALIARNQGLRDRLHATTRAELEHPRIHSDEVFYCAAEGMRDLSMGANNPAKAAIEKGIQRIENGEADKHAADAVSSLLGLESAVARRQGLELAGAIQARDQRFRESYRPTASRNVPTGLLDVTGLGIVALGQLNDLQVTGDSVYLPIEVLES